MKKALKVILSTISGIIIFVIMLPIVVSIILQISVVQNFVVDFATSKLSEVTGTKISIGEVALDFFTSARLEDVLMEDYREDTLIHAKTISIQFNGINFITGKINIGRTTLYDAQINLYKDSTKIMNIAQVFNHFKRKVKNPDPPTFQLAAKELRLINAHFTLKEEGAQSIRYGVKFKDMDVRNINLSANNISVYNHNIWLEIESLDFNEKSGFRLDKFSSKHCGVDSSGMYYADVELLSNRTNIKLDSLNFLTANQSWWDWNTFGEKMIISAKVQKSYVSSSVLSYFVGYQFPRYTNITLSKAEVKGSIADLSGKLDQLNFQGNEFWGDFSIVGLPNAQTAEYKLNIEKLNSNASTIDNALNALIEQRLSPDVYDIVDNLGSCTLNSELKGVITNLQGSFAVNAENAGEIEGICNYIFQNDKSSVVQGYVLSHQLNIGNVLDIKKMKNTSFFADYKVIIPKAHPVTLAANLDISQFYYGAYNFEDININGKLESKIFDGQISCADSNFNIDITGILDFDEATPKYELDVDLHHADLHKIGVNKRDSVSLLSAEFLAQGSGTHLDDFNGTGTIDQILYINHLDTIHTEAIKISSIALPQYKELDIQSDFADVTFRGRNSFNEIGRYLAQSFSRFLPSLPEVGEIVNQEDITELSTIDDNSKQIKKQNVDFPFSEGYYQLKVDIKKANNVAGIFVPSLNIASGSTLSLFFNPYLDQFSFNTKSDFISSDNFLVEGLDINSRNISDSLSLYSTVSLFAIGDMIFDNISILSGIHNNIVSLGGQFKQNNGRNSALINTTTSFTRLSDGTPQMNIRLHPSPLMFDSIRFNLANSQIAIDTSGMSIADFSIYNDEQELTVHGKLGDFDTDTIKVRLTNADLSPATILIDNLGYEISGRATGEVSAVAALEDIQLTTSIEFSDVMLSGYDLGESLLRGTNNSYKKQLDFTLGRDATKTPATGFYNYETGVFGGDFQFDSLPLVLLDPMLKGVLVNSSGTAQTNLKLRGKGKEVLLNGDIAISDYTTTLDYTKVRYTIPQAEVKVNNSSFSLASTHMNDAQGGDGTISAELSTTSFKNLKYHIGVSFTDLLALNTTFADNSSFYGKAYGTGIVKVKGDQKSTSIDVNAKTAKSSSIIMPFSGASTAERMDFIRYVDADQIMIRRNDISARLNEFRKDRLKQLNKQSNILDVKLNIEVLPNAIAQLELDAKVGDIIKGRGEGRLDIHINPDLDIFTINGPIQITEGNYLFTLQTIINKRFTINPGGQLFWTGDATNPDVNLTAVYKIKTSVAPLIGSTDSGSSNTNIDCGIILTGKLLSPDINFTITAPSSDIETQNYIRNSINTQEALSMQFLSLMLANTFMSDMGTAAIGTMGSSVAGVTGLEFLSNQLSNLISNDNLNIRFGYRPQNTTTSDEFYAGVGADIISDVLSIEVDGNYNAMNNSVSSNQNPFSVDAYLTWNMNQSGSLKLKGFTRTIDRFDETQGMQESGIGVYYNQEFSNLKDLKERVKNTFTRDSTQIQKAEQRKAEREAKKEARQKAKEKEKEEKQKNRKNDDNLTKDREIEEEKKINFTLEPVR